MNGLFWALMPILGWSFYSLEASYTSCSVEWKDKSLNVVSFNLSLFSFLYLIPVIVILVTSIKLIIKVKKVGKIFLNKSENNALLKRRIKRDNCLSKTIIIIIGKNLNF